MSTIPLPALDVRPPATPPNPLEEFARVAQIRGQMQTQQSQQQEMQLRQQQINDTQATTSAMKSADPNSPTYFEDVGKGILSNNGSASAVAGWQKHALDVKQATLGLSENQLKDFKAHQENLADQLGPLLDPKTVPDDQLHGETMNKINDMVNNRILDPAHAAPLQQAAGAISDPTLLRAKIQQIRDMTLGSAALASIKKTGAETTEAEGKGREANANAALKEIETKGLQGLTPQTASDSIDKVFDPNSPQTGGQNRLLKAQVLSSLNRGDLTGAQKALQDGFQSALGVQKDVAVATNPLVQQGKINVAAAEGQARANTEAQVARGSNAALAQVPPHLVAPATAAATKAGEDYDQAKSVTDRLKAMMEDARKGNVVSYQLIPEEGALQLTTSQGVHRINMAEIQNYGGGSLWQRMQGHIGKALTGESIPSSVLSDMEEMQKIQAQGSRSKYENTLKTINQNYGSKFTPAEPDDMNSKFSGTTRIKASDGTLHDVPTANLEAAKKIDPGLTVQQ